MEPWLDSELHARRDELLESTRRARLMRLAESGRSSTLRTRIADGAQAVSDLFASLADAVRDA